MAEVRTPWRFGARFSPEQVAGELVQCAGRSVTVPSDGEMTDVAGYNRYYSEALVAQETPGTPVALGAFDKARVLVKSFAFSDPRIVRAHFDPMAPLLGRTMVLELCAYGLCYLCGVRVTRVRELSEDDHSLFAFRYDTMEGHIERGAEWFVLRKDHRSGDVQFRIEANWRPGVFPNWWSRVGFRWVGPRFQRAWHRLAYLRLRDMLEARGLPQLPRARAIMHPRVPVDAPRVAVVGRAPAAAELNEQEVHARS